MRSALLLLCPLALLAVSRPALGVQAPRLEPGTRLRLDATNLGSGITGTLVAWESDTLFVKVDGDAAGLTLMLSADAVTRIDVWRERRMTLEGAGIGLLGGTLLALVASPEWMDDNGNCTPLACLAYKVSPRLDTRVAVLGGVGTLLGLIVGSETKRVRWAPVQSNGGVAVGVSIAF